MAGCVGNVLGSMEQLDANYRNKVLHLSPAVALTTISDLQQLLGSHLSKSNLFTCGGPNTSHPAISISSYDYINLRASCGYLSATRGMVCHVCKNPMNKPMTMAPDAGANGPNVVAAVPTTYAVKDDLSVTPASNLLSGITLLAQCGVKDISTLQEKTVKIGKEEVRWYYSLVSFRVFEI
jgi:hypothetical protein